MKKETLNFVKQQVERKYKFIEENDQNGAGMVAAGLFNSQEFFETVFELFGSGWVKETRSELPNEPKDFVLSILEDILEQIDKELRKDE